MSAAPDWQRRREASPPAVGPRSSFLARTSAADLAADIRRQLRVPVEPPDVTHGLVRLIDRLHRIRDAQSLLTAIPEGLCGTLGFSRAMISTVVGASWYPHTTFPATGPYAGRFPEFHDMPIRFRPFGVESELARRRTTLLIDGARGDERASHGFLSDTLCRTYLAAPITAGSRLVAVLHVDRLGQARCVDEGDRQTLNAFVGAVSELWHLLQLHAQRRELAARFNAAVEAVLTGAAHDTAAPEAGRTREVDGRAARRRCAGRVLSRRELEVLERIATGATSRQVAEQLGITEATVKSHLKHIYRRLRLVNRSQAVAWFLAVDRPNTMT